ncbi:hypothetical protein [Sphingorhabdus lutea]|nr:hypothetical protein [Sphingorhabdus lutea]
MDQILFLNNAAFYQRYNLLTAHGWGLFLLMEQEGWGLPSLYRR